MVDTYCAGRRKDMTTATELSLADLTPTQIGKMRHALGLDYSRKPYRNYYYCSAPNDEWEDLVQKGFATKQEGMREGSVYYFVTYPALKLLYRKNVTEKYFNEL
jgi:hypothetical protein